MNTNPINFEFDNKILFAHAVGDILFEDIFNHYQLLFTLPDFFIGMPALYDFTKVSKITGDLTHFEQTVKDMGNNTIINVSSHVAIVVSSDNISMNAIFNAYSQMMDYTLMNVQIFHDKDKALLWLEKK